MNTRTAPALGDLAASTSTGRNRALDFSRVVATASVALGHCRVIAIGTNADGELFARNALEVAPETGWLTWGSMRAGVSTARMVTGWLLFQMIGFLWRDDVLPTGRRLVGLWLLMWASAVALVALGLAQTFTAISAAPAVTRWVERNRRAQLPSVDAGGRWQLDLDIGVPLALHRSGGGFGVLYAVGALPLAVIGSSVWWIQKVPAVALALLMLLPILSGVARVERGILFAERSVHPGGLAPAVGLVSTSIKAWSLGVVGGVVAGALLAAALLRPSAATVEPAAASTCWSLTAAQRGWVASKAWRS
ncbi:MAG: succinate dehydrogenase hydrophobic anchor subunit [Ilumatobacter sp.]|jgi:succinate dehydrogenase hydrophobic anchor subunit